MEAESLQLTSQLLQAMLVGSSALAGFAGVLIVQFARLARRTRSWDKWAIGIITLVCGISFVFCVMGAINWFDYQLTSDLSMARNGFISQSLSFLLLFLLYVYVSFFIED